MTSPPIIQVIESWNTTTFGVIAELAHYLEGLPSGLIIKSTTTSEEWRVKQRVLYYHTFGKQRKFDVEAITYVHASFAGPENLFSSAKNILDKEEQNIFEYRLQPVGHNAKPKIGDTL